MSLPRFLLGVPLAVVAFAPVVLAASAWRRALFPRWSGVEGRLIDVVLVSSVLTAVCELVGTVGWFRCAPVVIALALAGAIARALAYRRMPELVCPPAVGMARSAGYASAAPSWAAVVAIGGALVVIGSWLTRTVGAIRHGMTTVDTLWYHLPAAARFAQTGRIAGIQYFNNDPATAFYPSTSSMFHGVGFLLFRTDLLSTVINVGWLTVALCAAWSIGRAFGCAPAALLGVALLFGTPGLVGTQPGGAYDDTAGIALLLVALAILVHQRGPVRSRGEDATIALAAGLALGMKDVFILPAATLCLAAVLTTPNGSRWRRAVIMGAGAFATGGFWYVRNTVVTGSPLPTVSLRLGPLALATRDR